AVTLAILTLALLALGRALVGAPRDASMAERTRYDGTVAIFYCSQFEDTPMHDWVPIKEWNGPYHPTLGEYRTDDRKIIQQHLRWLRRAGVDVIFYDVARIQPELSLLDLPKQKTLQLLVDELSHQEKEPRKLKLVVWMEKWNSNPTPGQYKFGLDYIRKNLANRDFYYRLDGKPLVLSYLNGPAPDHAKIEQDNQQFFTIRHVTSNSGTPGWKYFGPAGDHECMTVNPGADGFLEDAFIRKYINKQPVDDNALRERGKAVITQRANGKYFENQLVKARQTDPKVIFVSGWNDWAWCLQIEPAKEYGFQYVDLLARLLGRESETLPYRQPE
ncbi:MAG: glycoside hydrolase family 99-like domain-containing protein, partial [Thermoguttaceae bacterium]